VEQEGKVPLLCAHGVFDNTNRIERVREDVMMSSVASLHEFEDGHSLSQLEASGAFEKLLLLLFYRTASAEAWAAWLNDRPQWISEQLQPKMGGTLAGDASTKDDLERARELRRSRLGILAELNKPKK